MNQTSKYLLKSVKTSLSRVKPYLPTPSSYEPFFVFLLVIFVFAILVDTFSYRSTSRLVPLVIGVPTFLIFTFILLSVIFGPFYSRGADPVDSDLNQLDEIRNLSEMSPEEPDEVPLEERRKQTIVAVLWILGFLVFMVLVGFIPGLVAGLLLFNKVYAGMEVTRNVLYTAILMGVIWLLFHEILNVRFTTGILF